MTDSPPRYFYSDPLAAAWMAKHFGMRFWNTEHEIHVLPLVDGEKKAYRLVHPESLHLLEPQLGDGLEFDRWHWERQRDPSAKDYPYAPHLGIVIKMGDFLSLSSAGIGWDDTFGGKKFTIPHKIIQRISLPFMWPEQEAA